MSTKVSELPEYKAVIAGRGMPDLVFVNGLAQESAEDVEAGQNDTVMLFWKSGEKKVFKGH